MNPSTDAWLEPRPGNPKADPDEIEVAWSQDDRDEAWDQFVSALPGAHHEQTSRWACVKRHQGWSAIRVICRKQRQIVGGAQLLFHRVRPFGVVGYVPRGPCLTSESEKLVTLLIRALVQTARRVGVWFLVIEPPYSGDFLATYFRAAGFSPHPENLPPVTMMAATVLLDLSQTEDEILAHIRESTRRNIRKGLRGTVRVREGKEEDLDVLFDLMLATCRRHGESRFPETGNSSNGCGVSHRLGWVRLCIAEHQGEPVCAEFSVSFSDTYRLWKFGWSGRYRNQNASDVIRWDNITWAKRMGFRRFDFVQVDPEVAAAITSGKPPLSELQSRRLYGSTLHKMGFGGKVTLLPGAYSCFLNPLLHHAYSAFGNSFGAAKSIYQNVEPDRAGYLGRIGGRISRLGDSSKKSKQH